MKIIHIKICLLMTALFFIACSDQNPSASAKETKTILGKRQEIRISPADVVAGQPAIAKDDKGGIYIIWVEYTPDKKADIFLQKFDTGGNKIGVKVRVNSKPGMATAWRGDPPTIKTKGENTVFVGWTGKPEDSEGSTNLYLSASHDGGNKFGDPVKINDDEMPGIHGLHSLSVDGANVYLAWLDERNLKKNHEENKSSASAMKHQQIEVNRELFFAVSNDSGRTFSANKKIAENVCPCCKTAMAIAPDKRVYIGWRQVVGEDFRHIAVTSSDDNGESFATRTIVSDDKWQFHGCPVSGPNLNVTSEGKLQVVWYTAGDAGSKGLYLAESENGGKTFGKRESIVEEIIISTPSLVQDGKNTFVLWEGIKKNTAGIKLKPISKTIKDDSFKEEMLAPNGSFLTAILSDNKIYTAYIREENKRQVVWLSSVELN